MDDQMQFAKAQLISKACFFNLQFVFFDPPELTQPTK